MGEGDGARLSGECDGARPSGGRGGDGVRPRGGGGWCKAEWGKLIVRG